MDENTREIEHEIVETRIQLDVKVRELESRVKSVTDWRWHYRRHVGAALAIGVCGGFMLESMTHRRRPRARRARYVESGRTRQLVATRKPSRIGGLFERLVTMGSKRAFDMIAERLVAGLTSYVRPASVRPEWFAGQAARSARPHAVVRGA